MLGFDVLWTHKKDDGEVLRFSMKEFAEQVSEDSVTYFSKANTTIIETCSNKMGMINNTGLNTIKTGPSCKVFTEDYTFVSPSLIEEKTNFVKRIDKIPWIDFFPDRNTKEIREQLEVLHMMKSTQKVNLSTLCGINHRRLKIEDRRKNRTTLA
jgi:hypothetical protein